MKAHLRMRGEELLYTFSLMRRKVVQNDMDFASPFGGCYDLLQKVDKLRARVARCSLADYLAGPDIECRVERKGSVPVVFESVLFCPTRRQRQHRVETVERLNSTLLIHAKQR